jgi:hypothetical protein
MHRRAITVDRMITPKKGQLPDLISYECFRSPTDVIGNRRAGAGA